MPHKEWPKLYKTGSKDQEVEWTISVSPAGDEAEIVTVHGQVGGKLQTATVRVSQGKNLGKANATTPLQQALLEAEAKWKKQLDKGYSEERGGAQMDLRPMLAHKFEDRKHKVQFPGWIQPKLDGVRAVAHRRGNDILLISRQNKEYKGLQHIRDELLRLMDDGESWDGELYTHGIDFQDVTSLVKKDRPESRAIQYHVYDAISDQPFEKRFVENVQSRLICRLNDLSAVVPVIVTPVPDEKCVLAVHDVAVEQGYEGVMLRWGTEPYKAGYRSEHLLKVKAFMDAEFEIVDVVCGVGKEADKATFVCRTDRGGEFHCRPRGRDKQRSEYLQNRRQCIGKQLTVRFFEWTTSDPPMPRFPVGVAIRDYE